MRPSTRIELLGIPFVVILGTFLHYAYELSGNAALVAVIAAIDESVWEHLKLSFWPAILWLILTYPILSRQANNFWFGKVVSISLMPLVIAVGFYGYIALLGHHALVWDILLFIFAIAVGQASAVAIYKAPQLSDVVQKVSTGILMLEVVAFGTLTFANIDLPMFVDFSQ